jgi:hypothetical protein
MALDFDICASDGCAVVDGNANFLVGLIAPLTLHRPRQPHMPPRLTKTDLCQDKPGCQCMVGEGHDAR